VLAVSSAEARRLRRRGGDAFMFCEFCERRGFAVFCAETFHRAVKGI